MLFRSDLWWLGATDRPRCFNLAIVDCTGHGVPGAMLSLLVGHSLDRIYSQQPNQLPAQALSALDNMVRTGLNQDSVFSESDDGCDAIILNIDRERSQIIYAGAKIDIIQLSARHGVLRHAAARTSLGYRDPPSEQQFPQDKTIDYDAGDVFVVVTDGFTDQVGGQGERLTSFGYKRLQAKLQACVGWDAQAIACSLEQTLNAWRGEQSQRDDITVVVFQL